MKYSRFEIFDKKENPVITERIAALRAFGTLVFAFGARELLLLGTSNQKPVTDSERANEPTLPTSQKNKTRP